MLRYFIIGAIDTAVGVLCLLQPGRGHSRRSAPWGKGFLGSRYRRVDADSAQLCAVLGSSRSGLEGTAPLNLPWLRCLARLAVCRPPRCAPLFSYSPILRSIIMAKPNRSSLDFNPQGGVGSWCGSLPHQPWVQRAASRRGGAANYAHWPTDLHGRSDRRCFELALAGRGTSARRR